MCVLLALEGGRGSWSGGPCSTDAVPADRLLERVMRSDSGTCGLTRFGGIYL